jgi:hypothetical protein
VWFGGEGGVSDLASAVTLNLQQKYRFPALKYLDFGWKRRGFSETPYYNYHFIHGRFTEGQFIEILTNCQEAGVEMIMDISLPELKIIEYGEDEDGAKASIKLGKY